MVFPDDESDFYPVSKRIDKKCHTAGILIFQFSYGRLNSGSLIFQERTGNNVFDHNGLTLQYKLDNEFDLVFVVAYQKILQLSYVDKFLNDIHLEFRDKYKNDLSDGRYFQEFDFVDRYNSTLQSAEEWSNQQAKAPKQMRTFDESVKSKKTVASMIERKGEEKNNKQQQKKKEVNFAKEGS